MKNYKTTFAIFLTTVLVGSVQLNAQDSTSTKTETKNINKNILHGRMFIDKNGDGYNDNAPDHDGDGIPNGLDPDYQKFNKKRKFGRLPYVDLNGDGINDNLQIKNKRKGFGPNNNGDITPQNGSGQTNGNKGQGNQKGKGNKK